MADPLSGFIGPEAPAVDDMYTCVQCGFCLQACPTYVETGLETESPRGRIALMKAVQAGRIEMTPAVIGHWDLCIQCRACEAVCPSGVPYGRLIEGTMAQVRRKRRLSWPARLISNLALNHLLPHQGRLSTLVSSTRLYQRSRLQGIVRRLGLLKPVSGTLHEIHSSLPEIPERQFKAEGQVIPAHGMKRARVGLLSGCVMPLIHGPQMESVASVLSRNGCEVVVPDTQVCCGAIHSHVGDLDRTRSLARRNIDAFTQAGVDAVIVASAGCGARMKEYGDLLNNDAQYADRAKSFDAMVKDVHEYLAELPLIPPTGKLPYGVTYQDSCHLSHAQRITKEPRKLLNSIPGVDLVEMENSSRCCGAGGTYTITQRDFSLRLLDNKMGAIEKTGADVLATANPGCVLQLGYGAQRHQTSIDVRYVTDLLEEAYRIGDARLDSDPGTND